MTSLVSAEPFYLTVYSAGLIVSCISIAVCGILIVAVLNERHSYEQDTKYFTWFLITIMLSAIVESMICLLIGSDDTVTLIRIMNCIGYTLNQCIIFFFSLYMISNLRMKTYVSTAPLYVVAFACAFMSVIWAVSLYKWNFFANYDEFGNMIKSRYFFISNLVPAMVLFFDAALAISCRKSILHRELLSWISFIAFPVAGMLINNFVPLELVQQCEALAALMIYVNIHGDTARKMAQQQQELTESRVKVMMSQIQPHFMYNSLNSIYYLIGKDPETAQEAVSRFSSYLRSNINSLKSDRPVSFDTELNHVKTYLYLEKLRFDDELEIVYDIKERNFELPPLTIQPVVENAVKHGIGSRKGGGRISISTEKSDNYYEVKIEDNGIGFEVSGLSELPENRQEDKSPGIRTGQGESTHIGLINVRERIEAISGGQLLMSSKPGEGTAVIIRVPDKNKADGNTLTETSKEAQKDISKDKAKETSEETSDEHTMC